MIFRIGWIERYQRETRVEVKDAEEATKILHELMENTKGLDDGSSMTHCLTIGKEVPVESLYHSALEKDTYVVDETPAKE